MRDATKEERESVAKYIDSISVSTGLNFFDLVDSDTSEKSKNSLGTDMKSCDDTIESPRRVEGNLYREIQKTFPEILVKDLSKNERICPVCNGIGMKLTNNVYGIKGDTSEIGRKMLFPYKHQALSFCQSCFNGVQRLCPYCGKPYVNQSYLHCDCAGQKNADKEKRIKEWNEKFSKAVEVDEKDVDTMLYCEEFDEYYDSTDDFFDDYAANYSDGGYERPRVLWVTTVEKIHIDAADVTANACEYLHEDAYDQCDIGSLQKLLDAWCKDQYGATTYFPSFKQYVLIDWSGYNKGGE